MDLVIPPVICTFAIVPYFKKITAIPLIFIFYMLKTGYEHKKRVLGERRISTSTTTWGVRSCQHCQAKTTPEWREGPLGPRTLCNACGVRYKSGRLLPEYRPVNSPSFSGELHSNSHRKVLDMRRQKQS
ncbi:hypothetical protein ACHQM5_027802 [Ranunculus cassubicifolius]